MDLLAPPPAQCAHEEIMTPTGAVMATRDGGHTWQDLSPGLPSDLQPIVFRTDGHTHYLGTFTGLYRGHAASATPVWQKDHLPQREITEVVPGRDGPYAISHRNGFSQYHQSGKWHAMHLHLADQSVNTLLESPSGVLFAGCATGLYRSRDKGQSWDHILDKGETTRLVWSGDALIASGYHSLWRSDDDGEQWTRVLTQAIEPFHITHAGSALVAIAVGQNLPGIEEPNTIYWSMDHGITWDVHPAGLPSSLSSVYDVRRAGGYVYACSHDMILSSADNGTTWKPVLKVPENSGGFFKIEVSCDTLYMLWIQGC